MAQTGKKINELTAITTVSNETVLPAVYVSGGNASSTANKVSIEQISNKITNDLGTILNSKQDKLTAGDNINIENNVISEEVQSLPENVYTEENFVAGDGITLTKENDVTTITTTAQVPDNIWTSDNLIAGENISIEQYVNPDVIGPNTLACFHFEDNTDNAVTGSSIGFNPNANVTYQNTYTLQGFGKYAEVRTTQLLSVARTDYYSALTVDLRYIYPGGSSPNLYLIDNPTLEERVWIGPSADSFGIMYKNAAHPYGAIAWQGTSTQQNVHVATEVYNGYVNIYVNGTLVTSFATTYNFAATCYSSAGLVWLDELRISNVARYRGQNFTPPNQPYAASDEPAQYQINNTLDISTKQDALTTVTGYDATKTQILKNINGVLTWVNEA